MSKNAVQTVATALDGWEYGEPCPLTESFLKSAGVVVVTGSSDDLIQFWGAIDEELGCGQGTKFRLDAEGVLSPFDDVPHNEDEMREYFRREIAAKTIITAHWCDRAHGDYAWSFDIENPLMAHFPHETFNLWFPKDEREGETGHFCKALVFFARDL